MASHSTPNPRHPCWHCSAYAGLTGQGTAALCKRPECSHVRANPECGCVCFEREPGADDELWPPAGLSLSTAWSVDDSTAQRMRVAAVRVQWAP